MAGLLQRQAVAAPEVAPEAPPASERKTLRFGSKGSDVFYLQSWLNRAPEVTTHLAVDGNFGSKTRTAVRQFQQAHDLEVDGVVGSLTWAEVETVSNEPTGGGTGPGREDLLPWGRGVREASLRACLRFLHPRWRALLPRGHRVLPRSVSSVSGRTPRGSHRPLRAVSGHGGRHPEGGCSDVGRGAQILGRRALGAGRATWAERSRWGRLRSSPPEP